LVETYWQVGKYIVEFEQKGKSKAVYGENLLRTLSKDLSVKINRGFSVPNLYNMRLFYQKFPILQTLSRKLSWSHYVEIISIENELERNFYYNQSLKESWSTRELKRQKDSGLFMRLALSKNKKQVLEMSKKGQNIQKAEDIVKDAYILEFLKIPEKNQSESVLEKAIIDNLQTFLLELGKGFALFGRQYRMTINNTNFYADLVFYHVILKCYVVIDLKIGKVTHEDIGQMNMYLGYFALDKNTENDNRPIGIILAQEKNDIMVEYATYGIDSKLFVSKYQLYLPDINELRAVLANKLSLEN